MQTEDKILSVADKKILLLCPMSEIVCFPVLIFTYSHVENSLFFALDSAVSNSKKNIPIGIPFFVGYFLSLTHGCASQLQFDVTRCFCHCSFVSTHSAYQYKVIHRKYCLKLEYQLTLHNSLALYDAASSRVRTWSATTWAHLPTHPLAHSSQNVSSASTNNLSNVHS